MTKEHFDELVENIIDDVLTTRNEGQKEYAHTTDNVFANFERTGELLNTSPDKVLMTFLLKHIDGISAYTKGHTSQREDVTGRIKDAIVYLMLLWGMVKEKENDKRSK